MKTIAIILLVVLTALLIVGCGRFANQSQQPTSGTGDAINTELNDIDSSLNDPALNGPDLAGDLNMS